MMRWVRGCYSKAFRGATAQLRCRRCALKGCIPERKLSFWQFILICLIDLKSERAFVLQAARGECLPFVSMKCPLLQKQDSILQQMCCDPGNVPAGKQGTGKGWRRASQSKAKQSSRSHTLCVLLSLKPFVRLLVWWVVQCYPHSHWYNRALTFNENMREHDVCCLTSRSYPEKARFIESHYNKYCLCSKPATLLYLLPLNQHQSHKVFSIELQFMTFLFKDRQVWI